MAAKKMIGAAKKTGRAAPNEADGRPAISPSQMSPAGRARAEALAKQYGFTLKEPAESGIGPDASFRTTNRPAPAKPRRKTGKSGA
jgi:hypothetical protein